MVLALALIVSCKESPEKPDRALKKKPLPFLPFKVVDLDGLDAFRPVTENWKTVGNAFIDLSQDKALSTKAGSGVLANLPEKGKAENIFTGFEHGDIEIELDVMMPKNSNSGLYFQGRYEVQLLDSWGVEKPGHEDMGGIYQRWDDSRGKGQEGFEGIAPTRNAAKAPGLWQHLKIVFHAPTFNASGQKTKNAWFEEVWLNGILIHENVALSGPTRAAAFSDEKPMGPLMIQGDHGPVAFKNIRYKLYDGTRVALSQVSMKEYGHGSVKLPDLDTLVPLREIGTDSISAAMATAGRTQRILKYTGELAVPHAGEYLFDLKVNGAGGLLLVGSDTVVNLDGDYSLDSLGLGKKTLSKGKVPFTLIYNKHRPWTRGFALEVEGPGMQKHAIQAPGSLDMRRYVPIEEMKLQVSDEAITQRSFLMHGDAKRTHCISVGTPKGVHYAYDLAFGTLLKAWSGAFLDATPMWDSRGTTQLGVPIGFTVSFHGEPGFATLAAEGAEWPREIPENADRRAMGYELDANGLPRFSYRVGQSELTDGLVPSRADRGLDRHIKVSGTTDIWHKIAAGESIEALPDGSFIVNDESYYVHFPESSTLRPVVRNSNGREELLVKIPSGDQEIAYTIIW